MNYLDQTPYDVKQTVKRGLIYLLIAAPFVLIIATILTIVKAPLWVIMVCNVTVGGAVLLLEIFIYSKIKEKRKNKQRGTKEFDPFKD